MSTRLLPAVLGSVLLLLLAVSSAVAAPSRYPVGSLDARLPAGIQGYACIERPGVLLGEVAAVFDRLRGLGVGFRRGWPCVS